MMFTNDVLHVALCGDDTTTSQYLSKALTHVQVAVGQIVFHFQETCSDSRTEAVCEMYDLHAWVDISVLEAKRKVSEVDEHTDH